MRSGSAVSECFRGKCLYSVHQHISYILLNINQFCNMYDLAMISAFCQLTRQTEFAIIGSCNKFYLFACDENTENRKDVKKCRL